MKELQCIYDSRQSFYGKAKTETTRTTYEQTIDLYSYDTLVASIIWNFEKGETIYEYYDKFSQTTTRHQKEFFKQNGLNDKQIKELFSKGTLVISY